MGTKFGDNYQAESYRHKKCVIKVISVIEKKTLRISIDMIWARLFLKQ